jgi:hypothetical protein
VRPAPPRRFRELSIELRLRLAARLGREFADAEGDREAALACEFASAARVRATESVVLCVFCAWKS